MKRPTPKQFETVLGALPDWLFIDAVRYAIGRMSAQVSLTTEWIRHAWPYLPKGARNIIKRDVEDAFKRDDDHRAEDNRCGVMIDYKPLGMDCDRACWEKVRELWKGKHD